MLKTNKSKEVTKKNVAEKEFTSSPPPTLFTQIW